MLARELLTTDFPVMRPEYPLHKATDAFIELCICHFPVISETGLEGILPIDLLIDIPDKGRLLSEFKSDYIHINAYKEQHGLDVFELMARFELTAIPVLDPSNNYCGTITYNSLTSRLSNYYSFKQPGGIIELTVGMHDYDLSEISRIVESNNAKILILYIDTDPENEQYIITLKVDTLDLDRILATFERFGYTIKFSHPSAHQKDELRDRYDLMMKLFDIK